jgi:hypothetical protein
MVNRQLLKYIEQQLFERVPAETIISNLLSVGWQQKDINKAFKKLANKNISKQDLDQEDKEEDEGDILKKQDKKAYLGLILAVLGMIAWLIPLFGVPINIVALINSIKAIDSREKNISIIGIVLSAVGLILSIINAVLGAHLGATGQSNLVNKIKDMQVPNVEYEYSLKTDTSNQDISINENADLVSLDQIVSELKNEIPLPLQIDELTKLVDVTAETDAIRYHYILNNVDTNALSNNILKVNLVNSVCQEDQIKELLNQDIRIEYSYSVEGSEQEYFVRIVKRDCL